MHDRISILLLPQRPEAADALSVIMLSVPTFDEAALNSRAVVASAARSS